MRKPLIAGNWKMFLNAREAVALVQELCAGGIDYGKTDVMVIPSFTNLYPVISEISMKGCPIITGAQNVYIEDSGAFTGEVSMPMLESLDVSAVLAGHSERRTIFNEHDFLINKKVLKIIKAGKTAILCVGEKS